MAKCHQCDKPLGADKRAGTKPCAFCLMHPVELCAACSYWEWGPVQAPTGLPDNLRKDKDSLKTVSSCARKIDEPDASHPDTVTPSKDSCPLFKKQCDENHVLFGTKWSPGKKMTDGVKYALATYDAIYRDNVSFNRDHMHVLLEALLSALAFVKKQEIQQEETQEENEQLPDERIAAIKKELTELAEALSYVVGNDSKAKACVETVTTNATSLAKDAYQVLVGSPGAQAEVDAARKAIDDQIAELSRRAGDRMWMPHRKMPRRFTALLDKIEPPPKAEEAEDARGKRISAQVKDLDNLKRGRARAAPIAKSVGDRATQLMDEIIDWVKHKKSKGKTKVIRTVHRHDMGRLAAKHLEKCFADVIPDSVPTSERRIGLLALQIDTLDILDLVLKDLMSVALAREEILKHVGGAAEAKKLLQISLILYHCRAAGWDADKPPPKFDPSLAAGYMHPDHRKFLFGDAPADPPLLSDGAKTRLGTLYASFDLTVPPGPRFPDPAVSGCGDLSDSQKRYLQALPRFDHGASEAGKRTACEMELRKKVLDGFAALNLTDPINDTKLDEIVADMRANYYIESASSDGLLEAYADDPAGCALRSETMGLLRTIKWEDALPCPKIKGSGTFEAMEWDLRALRGRSDGRQECPQYLDWRNFKDRYLYLCYSLTVQERPNFTSLNLSPGLPELNTTYGKHMICWKRAQIVNRCIYTIGDKGNPRRSMLALLRDLLYPTPQCDGSEGPNEKERHHSLANILERYRGRNRRVALDQTNYDALLAGDKTVTSTAANIECQVFGPVKLNTCAEAIALEEGATSVRVLAAVTSPPPWTHIKLPKIPADRTTRKPKLNA